MLYLNTRIHFNKVWIVISVYQKLQCSCIDISNIFTKTDCCIKNLLSCLVWNGKCRRILYDLLVTSLHRAVTVEQMHNIAVIISDHLNLNMLWSFQIFLNENHIITESFFRFISRLVKFLFQISRIIDNTHPTSATTVGSFQHNRISDHVCDLRCLFIRFHRVIYSRDDRYICCNGNLFGRNLISHCSHNITGRSNKCNAILFTCIYKLRIL